jgi:predicted GIY-YIG superfamily endonuclease
VHYVYLLVGARSTKRRYVGVTTDLKQRLAEHNSSKSPHTAEFKHYLPRYKRSLARYAAELTQTAR